MSPLANTSDDMSNAYPVQGSIHLSIAKVTTHLRLEGFPVFGLLPAGVGETNAERIGEAARTARADERRRVALEEIDRAKQQQATFDVTWLTICIPLGLWRAFFHSRHTAILQESPFPILSAQCYRMRCAVIARCREARSPLLQEEE